VKPDSSWFGVIANLPKSPKPLQARTIRGSLCGRQLENGNLISLEKALKKR
jgi:hypothetical protein